MDTISRRRHHRLRDRVLRERPDHAVSRPTASSCTGATPRPSSRLTEKIGRREGFGDVLADGVWAAWKRLGRIGTEFAVHIQGEEIPAHDPKFTPGLASTYWLTATPGRHTQGGELVAGPGVPVPPADKYVYQGQAEGHHLLVAVVEVVNAAGLCLFGYLSYPFQAVLDQLSAATGDPWDLERVVTTGTRIYTMRHAFNLREGINPLSRNMPGRSSATRRSPEGNVRDVTVDHRTLAAEFLDRLGWDRRTTVPMPRPASRAWAWRFGWPRTCE